MIRSNTEAGCSRPIIAVDGTESVQGRGIFAVSGLYWCLDWLPEVNVRFIDVADENVHLALDVFRWQHGISVEAVPPGDSSSLNGVDLYAAAAFRSANHLRLQEAAEAGVPTLLALQFPEPEWFSASVVLRMRAAFDPRLFAAELETFVKSWL